MATCPPWILLEPGPGVGWAGPWALTPSTVPLPALLPWEGLCGGNSTNKAREVGASLACPRTRQHWGDTPASQDPGWPLAVLCGDLGRLSSQSVDSGAAVQLSNHLGKHRQRLPGHAGNLRLPGDMVATGEP